MGISGLLPLLKDISNTTHISNFAGSTLGVDAYVWLHRGAYGCAQDLVLGKETTKYVDYAIHRVRMLKHFNITPYIVFDGDNLPSKLHTETDRERKRAESLARARTLLREERFKEAREIFAKCIDITPEMAYQLIKALKAEGVSYVVAPYEADAQLTFLEKVGLIDGIITEDSDLLVFGCKRVLFKFDSDGDCEEVLASRLGQVQAISLVGWGIKEFRQMAILSGCDYLPSIIGMGLKKSHALLRRCKTIEKVLQIVRFDGTMKVPTDYAMEFRRAELTFEHQRVFDPRGQDGGRMSFLNPLPEGVNDFDMPFIGASIDDEVARGIARGDIDPNSKERMKDIAPNFKPHLNTTEGDYQFKVKMKTGNKSSNASNKGKGKASNSTSSQIQGQSSLLKFLRPKPESPSTPSSSSRISFSETRSKPSGIDRSPLKNLNRPSGSSLTSSPMMMLTESQEATLEVEEEEAFKLQRQKKPICVETTSRSFQGKTKKVKVSSEGDEEDEEVKVDDEEMGDVSEDKGEVSRSSLASRFTFRADKVDLKRKRSKQSHQGDEVADKERKEGTPSESSSDQAQLSDKEGRFGIENDDSGFWQNRNRTESNENGDGEGEEWDCDDLENLITGKGWTPTGGTKSKRSRNRGTGLGSNQGEIDEPEKKKESSDESRRQRCDSLASEIPSLDSSPLAKKMKEEKSALVHPMQGILDDESQDDKSEGVLSSPFSESGRFQISNSQPSGEAEVESGFSSPVSPLQEKTSKTKLLLRSDDQENRNPFEPLTDDGLLENEENEIGMDGRAPPSSDPIESDSSPRRPTRRSMKSRSRTQSPKMKIDEHLQEEVEEIDQVEDDDDDDEEEEEARIQSVAKGLRERFTFKSPAPNQIGFDKPNLSRSSSATSFRLGAGPVQSGRAPKTVRTFSTPKLQFSNKRGSSTTTTKRSLSFQTDVESVSKGRSAFQFEEEGIVIEEEQESRWGSKGMEIGDQSRFEGLESPAVDRVKRLESKGKPESKKERIGDSKSALEQFRFVRR